MERDLLRDGSPEGIKILIDALCAADRPESILTWKRSDKVQELLSAIASGATPLSHDGLDQYVPRGKHVEHLRSVLLHHQALPARDKYIALFERWLEEKLANIANADIERPVRQFATWHHLRRMNEIAHTGKSTRGPVQWSKQEITETLKFLQWLRDEHGRTIATCVQQDVDQWVTTGPTTRHAIRTFLVWCANARINRSVSLGFRQANTVRLLTQDQRLAWIRELLEGDSESLPYRVAGTLLLLYAQPLVKVTELPMAKVIISPDGLALQLGVTRSPVPAPFDSLLRQHIERRPNLRTSGADSPWLFPGYRCGEHLLPNTLMIRLRDLGINLLGARNTAIRELVTQVPAPVVAEMLGYSDQVTQRHAELASQPWGRYASAQKTHT
ncbi:recombinase XerD [Gordonia sp. AC31]|uniref:recombinase XerD n=1 Tax=Gordonia sp. AC31 TaxID=2962571 RepID=UPI002889531D|nr:recombinase XerD [Gordonia sp. AC31]